MLGRVRWAVALLAAASLTAVVPALPAGAQESATGTITGTVVDDIGNPAAGVCVYAQTIDHSPGANSPRSRADDRGAYAIQVPSRTYVLLVSDCNGEGQYVYGFQGGGERKDAPEIEVTAGAVREEDLVAVRAGRVSGTVRFEDGDPAEGECVRVYGEPDPTAGFLTGPIDADGSYTVPGVRPGPHRVRFGDCRGGSSSATTWYRNGRGYDEAEPVDVAPGATVTGIDGTVRRYATLSGRVVDEAGEPVAACAHLQSVSGGGFTGQSDCTDSDGRWRIERVRPSAYVVNLRPAGDSDLVPRYYPGAPTQQTAAPVVAIEGIELPDLDVVLPRGGRISGRVTDVDGVPLAGACVRTRSFVEGGFAKAGPDGRYVMRAVDAGTHQVSAGRCDSGNYAPGWYGAAPGAEDPSTAGLQVELGRDLEGIDISLVAGGTVSGRVLDASGAPLPGICASAYHFGALTSEYSRTDEQGRYALQGLPTSESYHLHFEGCETVRYAQQYSGSTPFRTLAESVRTTSGDVTTYRDVVLQLAGQVSGTVADARTGLRVESVGVMLLDPETGATGPVAFTDESGRYTVQGVAPGRYVTYFYDGGANVAVPEFWDDALLREDATPIEVVAEQERSGVDADVLLLTVPTVPRLPEVSPLEEGAVLTWTPPVDDGSAPIETYEVTDQLGTVLTTAEGAAESATVSELEPGRTYALSVRAKNRKGAGPSTDPVMVVPKARTSSPSPRPSPGTGGGTATTPPSAATGDRFSPLPPERVLDTREGTGGVSGRLAPGRPVSLPVTGRGGVPPSGVRAVVLNTTVTGPSESGYLTVFPGGSPPLASNLNFARGQTVANLVTVPVAADGTVQLVANAGSPHVIADVVGWYGRNANDAFGPLAPSRVLDTRSGNGLRGRLAPGRVEQLVLRGRGGLPPDGATAVVLNLTATGASASGHLTAFPCGGVPETSNLNYPAGATVPNLAIVPLTQGGSVCLQSSAGSPHVVADVVGWYGSGAPRTFHGLTPARVIDTRDGTGTGQSRLSEGGTRAVRIVGSGGLPQDGVRAVLMNVTVTGPSAAGYLTVHPGGSAPPLASSLNFVRGQTVPNLVVVPVAADGTVSFTSNLGSPHLIADVVGWYG